MTLTLEDMDDIIGFAPQQNTNEADPDGAIPSGPNQETTQSRKRASAKHATNDSAPGDANPSTKRRRLTTNEKVQQFLLGGQWNALLPPDQSALSSEFTKRVSKAAQTMGLPERQPDSSSSAPGVDPEASAASAKPLAKQPVYKSIDNLVCLMVATPAHRCQPDRAAAAPTAPTLTSKASFYRTPTPTAFVSEASPSNLGSASPVTLPALKSTPTLPRVMDMPPMIRSLSGTQLACF